MRGGKARIKPFKIPSSMLACYTAPHWRGNFYHCAKFVSDFSLVPGAHKRDNFSRR